MQSTSMSFVGCLGELQWVRPFQVFTSSDKRQLVQIPGTEPAERFHTLVVNLAKSKVRGVFRFREFVSFRGEAVYPEYLVAYQRVLK